MVVRLIKYSVKVNQSSESLTTKCLGHVYKMSAPSILAISIRIEAIFMLQYNNSRMRTLVCPDYYIFDCIIPGFRAVLLNNNIHRNVVGLAIVVDCRNSYLINFPLKMYQPVHQIACKSNDPAPSWRIRSYNSDIIRHTNRPLPLIQLATRWVS